MQTRFGIDVKRNDVLACDSRSTPGKRGDAALELPVAVEGGMVRAATALQTARSIADTEEGSMRLPRQLLLQFLGLVALGIDVARAVALPASCHRLSMWHQRMHLSGFEVRNLALHDGNSQAQRFPGVPVALHATVQGRLVSP